MQKATVWNMPIAPIVAKDWGSFVDLPKQVKSTENWGGFDPVFPVFSALGTKNNFQYIEAKTMMLA